MDYFTSAEADELRREARRLLDAEATPERLRGRLDAPCPFDQPLWDLMAAAGWQGGAISARFGGAGLGDGAECVLAEEIGRALVPVPYATSSLIATRLIDALGTDAQRERLLPPLAAGTARACLAFAEHPGESFAQLPAATLRGGRLRGTKRPVIGGLEATVALVSARTEEGEPIVAVAVLDDTASRSSLARLDLTQSLAELRFDDAPAERLGPAHGDVWLDAACGAAVPLAFVALGLAQRCLDDACAYARTREAFGRPIASFQALKHRLADLHAQIELARSSAEGAALAARDAGFGPRFAAAAARLACGAAAWDAAREGLHVYGGQGFTWDSHAHLRYRRARALQLTFGGDGWWRRVLLHAAGLVDRPAPAGPTARVATG